MRMRWQVLLVAGGLVLAAAGSGFAAGFALIEQSGSGLGTAYSGAAAAEDATTVFYNPAGMTRLEGTQAVGALHYINPFARMQVSQATNALGRTLGSDSGGDGAENGLVPNLYVSTRAGRLAYGLGINAPFGLSTKYNKTWVGRYHAVESALSTININPSVAVDVNDWLSLGAGVSAQYLDVQLSNMVDFGLAAYSASGGNPALLPFVSNTAADVYADMTADSWGYGYNLGAMVKYAEGGRIGLAYRSRIEHTVKGDADFTVGTALAAQAAAAFPDQEVKGNITLPATASVNIYQEITPTWAVTADVTWTEWSTFGKLVIEFDQGVGTGLTTKQSVTTEDWADSWRYSVGTTVKASDALTLRGGLAYDETPISEDSNRTPRIPDEDRFWVAFGGGYKLSEQTTIDIGYAHLFVKDAQIAKVDNGTGENKGRGNLFGEYDNHVNILSAQLTYKF